MVSEDKRIHKRGPKPERVKIEADWEDAVKTALEKKRPEDGWPDHKDEKSHSGPDSDDVEAD